MHNVPCTVSLVYMQIKSMCWSIDDSVLMIQSQDGSLKVIANSIHPYNCLLTLHSFLSYV